MKIIIDTREQLPLKFRRGKHIKEIEHIKLDYGDYRAVFKDGHIPPFVFERKSMSDLFGTFGKGYPRFKKEIIRAQDKGDVIIIIVEGSLSEVFKGIPHSKRKGSSIVSQLFTLMVRHHIPFVCCTDRKEMVAYITQFYISVGKRYIERKLK